MLAPLITLEQYQAAGNTTRNLSDLLFRGTRYIEEETGRRFLPYMATKTKRVVANSKKHWLFDDLLEATSVLLYPAPVLGGPRATPLTLTTDDYRVWGTDTDINVQPATIIEYFYYRFTCGQELDITGTWGYHTDYPAAWQTVDTLAADVDAGTTSIQFATPAALDVYGNSVMQTFGLYRVESEFLLSTAVNTTTGVATVERAAHGSTAAAHLTGAAIERFIPDPGIVDIAIAWTKWLDHEKRQHTRQDGPQRGAPTPFVNSDLYGRLVNYRRKKL